MQNWQNSKILLKIWGYEHDLSNWLYLWKNMVRILAQKIYYTFYIYEKRVLEKQINKWNCRYLSLILIQKIVHWKLISQKI